ncbi:MAG: WD40 repeat domain-containing protein [Leptodesmis sp.]|uniref:WD40 repeat domain-containing protein n=1 Tax=Leptodesmis sp. TaxID=3100501 RepID=UPI003D0A0AAA
MASASEDNTIQLWTTSGRLLETLRGHRDGVLAVAFSPEGDRSKRHQKIPETGRL